MVRWLPTLAVIAAANSAAATTPCSGNPDALGTERVLMVDVRATPRVGRKHFASTLPLAPKEVVLTFDDGPWPGATERVLDALHRECVKATFFLVGARAAENPRLARRVLAEGHTVAHHTFSHRLLDHLSVAAAEAEIDRGIAAVEKALYGRLNQTSAALFFRFPGFASSPALLDRLSGRGIVVFGADLWASDWNPMFPADQLHLVMNRLGATGGGILLFHDTRAQTAAMIPAFLRALKRQGYRVVHVMPAAGLPALIR